MPAGGVSESSLEELSSDLKLSELYVEPCGVRRSRSSLVESDWYLSRLSLVWRPILEEFELRCKNAGFKDAPCF